MLRTVILLLTASATFSLKSQQFYKNELLVRITPLPGKSPENLLHFAEEIQSRTDLSLAEEWALSPDFTDFRIGNWKDYEIVKKMVETHKVGDIEILHDNIQDLIDHEITGFGSSFNYSTYNTWDNIDSWIDSYAAENAPIVSRIQLAESYEGKIIRAFKFSNPDSTFTGKKGAVILNTGFHAREWIGPAHIIYLCGIFADKIASNDQDFLQILSKIDLYVIPMANPDGYAYTWTSNPNARMWRKTRSDENEGAHCAQSANEYGVDPNRNFDAHWGQPDGASTNVCSIQYKGPFPESEIEVSSQAAFMAQIAELYDDIGYVDLHNYSQFWMYPYGYTMDSCDDEEILHDISTDIVTAIQNTYSTKWKYGQISEVVYVASGSSADYFYDELDIICSFAAELRDTGRYGFLLPDSQIPLVANEMWNGYQVMIQAVVDGKCSKRSIISK